MTLPQSIVLRQSELTREQWLAEYGRRVAAERLRRGDPTWRPQAIIFARRRPRAAASRSDPDRSAGHCSHCCHPDEAAAAHAAMSWAGRPVRASLWSRLKRALAAFLKEFRA
jgi:hypothetical protein